MSFIIGSFDLQINGIFHHLMLSADNLCKQFGPLSGWPDLDSNLLDTLMVFLKEYFEKS